MKRTVVLVVAMLALGLVAVAVAGERISVQRAHERSQARAETRCENRRYFENGLYRNARCVSASVKGCHRLSPRVARCRARTANDAFVRDRRSHRLFHCKWTDEWRLRDSRLRYNDHVFERTHHCWSRRR
jgi:hypothetical protein